MAAWPFSHAMCTDVPSSLTLVLTTVASACGGSHVACHERYERYERHECHERYERYKRYERYCESQRAATLDGQCEPLRLEFPAIRRRRARREASAVGWDSRRATWHLQQDLNAARVARAGGLM